MKTRNPGPTKFAHRGKTVTSALAVTLMIGIWNYIGHMEANSEQVQAVEPTAKPPVADIMSLPPIMPLPTLAPIPTLALSFSSADMTESVSGNAVALIMPAMPALSPIPTMAPLPSLPALPAPPPPSSSSSGRNSGNGGNSGSSSQKSGGS